MADVFVSYASADRARVQPIAQALEQRGWDVWWDREIPLGRPYNEIIPEELDKARCVLVLWSKQSAQSSWVYEEAAKGRDRKILIPALLEATEIPMGFGLLQTADLTQWQPGQPGAGHAGFDQLTANIQDVLDGKAAPGPDRSRPRRRFAAELPRWLTWTLAALVIGVGAALWLAQRPAQAPQQSVQRGKVTGAKLAHTLSAHTKGVNKVAYSPDGSVLASAGADGRLILWNSATRNAIVTLTAHGESVTSIAFAPNAKLFASGSWLGEVILWDAARREALGEPIAAHEVSVDDIAFSPDSALMATSSSRDGGKVKVWDVPSGKLRYERNAGEGAAYCVAFSPDGTTLASGSGKYLALWNAADGQALLAPFLADDGVVYDIAFSADGKVLATAGIEGVRLWNTATRKPLGAMLEAHGDQVNGVAFNVRGDLFASAAHGNTVILWDRNTQQVVGEPLTGHTDYVDAVAFAPDGKQLASAGHDGKVNVWELMFEQR